MRQMIAPEPALLGFLLDGPMHGYDLYKQVNSQLGLTWHIGMSQMYAVVKSFSTRGWIRTKFQSQELRPSKKMLEITPAGRAAFEDWLNQPARGLREFRVDFFLRLYFARTQGPSAASSLVNRQIAAAQTELDNLNTRRVAARAESELFQLTREFRITQMKMILKWLAKNRDRLTRLPRSQDE
jgi:DNA-binding PadR family transcriptional regulator